MRQQGTFTNWRHDQLGAAPATRRRAGRLPTLLLSVFTLLAALFAPATSAAAAGPSGDHPRPASKALPRDEARTAADYWTSARMREALPGERLARAGASARRSNDEAKSQGPARRVDPSLPKAPPQASAHSSSRGQDEEASVRSGGYYWGAEKPVKWTTGKVFFTLNGRDYVCSGSAVTSTNRDLVTTAGHCVKDGSGSWATNWVFVPAYENGYRPYGTWSARLLMTTNQWANSGDLNYGIAMVATYANSGGDLVNVVGGQGIAWNQPRGLYTYAFGFPAGYPYDGQWLYYCEGYVFDDPYGRSTQGIGCDMTGGSSGGPWLMDFDPGSGTGYINSNTSYGYTNDPGSLYGPYYGDVAGSLYNYAENR